MTVLRLGSDQFDVLLVYRSYLYNHFIDTLIVMSPVRNYES